MPVQKFVSTEKHNIDGTTHVGDNNRLFFDVATRTFRLGDGVTPGGIVIAGVVFFIMNIVINIS